MTPDEFIARLKERAAAMPPPEKPPSPLKEYGLDNVDCPICGNTGYIIYKKDDCMYSRDCECMPKRRSLRELNRSGLKDLAQRYTFENYIPDNDRAASLLEYAKKYVEDDPAWFFVSGQPGSGKSHICTAICLALINRGAHLIYMLWRDEVTRLKGALVDNPDYYQRRMDQLKKVQVLYIDDFGKGKFTDSDQKIAFELLNYRYNNPASRTIISSELDFSDIKKLDVAIARRIYERAEGYCRRSPAKNYSIDKVEKID